MNADNLSFEDTRKKLPIHIFIPFISVLFVLGSNVFALSSTISGTVYRNDGVTPILNSNISIFLVPYQCSTTIPPHKVAVDQANGTYSLENLDAGTYYLSAVDATGEFFTSYWANPISVDACKDSSPIVIAEGEQVSGKDFQLDKAAKISGTLYDTTGTPITGVSGIVKAYTGKSCKSLEKVGEADVDTATGTYVLGQLPVGNYYLFADAVDGNFVAEWWSSPNSVIRCSDAAIIPVTDGDVVNGKDFQLDTGTIISGTVFAEDGTTPVTGEYNLVGIYEGTDCGSVQYIKRTMVDPENGSYTIDKLPEGRFYLIANANDDYNFVSEWWATHGSSVQCSEMSALDVGRSDVISNKNFQLDTGAVISGTVFESDGSTPVITKSKSELWVQKDDPCKVFSYPNEIPYYSHATIDRNDGTYTVNSLPAGTYYLKTNLESSANYINEWWATPASTVQCTQAVPVIVEKSEMVSGKDFTIDTGAVIEGTIFKSDGITPVIGESIYINAYSGDPCGSHHLVHRSNIAQSSGAYSVDKLPAGTYFLRTEQKIGPYINEWFANPMSSITCEGAQPITVGVAETQIGNNFQLNIGTTISGTVYEQDGTTPIHSDYPLYVRAYQGEPCANMELVRSGAVNEENGTYSLGGLSDGEYYLQADDNYQTMVVIFSGGSGADGKLLKIDNFINDWWAEPLSSTDCYEASKINITNGTAPTNKDFQLTPVKYIPGDVNLDGEISLLDSVISLQFLTGSSSHSVWLYGDVDEDKKIGIQDTIYILEHLAHE